MEIVQASDCKRVYVMVTIRQLRNRAASPPISGAEMTQPSYLISSTFVTLLLAALVPLATADDNNQSGRKTKEVKWRDLFDGQSLADWKITNFGGEGEVTVEDGVIQMDYGSSLTGITYKGKKLPRTNYEISLEAMKVDGGDFFCALTFPVDKSYCSFIVGGWAGAIVGLSSIDGKDASENKTTRFMNFDSERWYKIRLRVTPKNISAWIDKKQVVDQSIVGHKISTRNEVDLSMPLGIAAWETQSALRKIRIRQLSKEEAK
jgi:hypothetical protein